jgi:hypothetical protein
MAYARRAAIIAWGCGTLPGLGGLLLCHGFEIISTTRAS